MKISIITVCYQSESTIERTLKSVAEQTYPDLEHVIVDGGSRDRTLEIVRKYPQRLGKVLSEADRGIYDAMNKGIDLSTGDYLLFLNSDDWLAGPDVVAEAVRRFSPLLRIQYGCLIYHHGAGHAARMGGPVSPEDLRYELKNFHQPACFFHRNLFKELGRFNTEYRISADYDLMRRFLEKENAHFLEIDITHMSDQGASASQRLRGIAENRRIAESFGESHWRLVLQAWWVSFWLDVRYRYPSFYRFAKKMKDAAR